MPIADVPSSIRLANKVDVVEGALEAVQNIPPRYIPRVFCGFGVNPTLKKNFSADPDAGKRKEDPKLWNYSRWYKYTQ